MKDLLLGIDIGTSGCKVAVFDRQGNVLAERTEGYPVYSPVEKYAEQNPDEWWTAVVDAVKAVLTNVDPARIAAVGVDGQSWSAVPVDREGRVLHNTPIWYDYRAVKQCTMLNAQCAIEFSVSGNPLSPTYSLPKVLWFKEERAEVYENTYKFLQSNSFIVYRLTGMFSQDVSQCNGYQCFDISKLRFDEALAKRIGLDLDKIPDIFECTDIVGLVNKEAAKFTGLIEGTPVVAGGLDAACAALGVGVISDGRTQEQSGTAGGMSICMSEPLKNPKLILGRHVVGGKWLLQGGTVGGAGVLRWMEKGFNVNDNGRTEASAPTEVGHGNPTLQPFAGHQPSNKSHTSPISHLPSPIDYAEFLTPAETIPPGSDGLIFLPYMAGERSPVWSDKVKGMYYGLDFSKTRGHMIRAGLEGVAYSLRHNLDTACGSGITEMYAAGGAAKSPLWCQIKSDVTGIPISVTENENATVLGAAMLAGVGVGYYRDFEEAVEQCVRVKARYEPERHEAYDRGYEVYLGLSEMAVRL
jgi:xylulokinase